MSVTCSDGDAGVVRDGDELASALEDLLENAEVGRTEFASSAYHVLEGPGTEIGDLGLLPLPVNSFVVAAVQRHSEGESESEWTIGASKLQFSNTAWDAQVPPAILNAVSKDLSVPADAVFSATLAQMLVSGRGDSGLANSVFADSTGPGA
jgi:hypothetical protein